MNNEERPAGTEAENEPQPMYPTSSQTIANTHVVGSQSRTEHKRLSDKEVVCIINGLIGSDETNMLGHVVVLKYSGLTVVEKKYLRQVEIACLVGWFLAIVCVSPILLRWVLR